MKRAHVLTGILIGVLALHLAGCSSDKAQASPLSPNYVAAQQALAADDFAQAKTALSALASETSAGDFQKEVQAAATATDIDGMRMAFRNASDTLIKSGVPAGQEIAYCPMYKGGASWVQKKGPIVNPYTGKSMPGCGSFKSKS